MYRGDELCPAHCVSRLSRPSKGRPIAPKCQISGPKRVTVSASYLFSVLAHALCGEVMLSLSGPVTLAIDESRRIMSHKKPTPILGEHNMKICPVCGKRSYSAGGIHPQCAVQQADTPRTQQIKTNKKTEAKKKPMAPKVSQVWNQKKCPECGAESHVRKKTCNCGFHFFKS